MNLLEIRQKFIKLSGRVDLASTNTDSSEENDVDAGADFYIQAAVRTLDREQENFTTESFYEETLAAGSSILQMADCRNVSKVWFVNSDGVETELLWMSFDELRLEYSELTNTDSGTPANWSLYRNSRSPRQRFSGFDLDIQSVMIMPPVDVATVVKVYGKFYSAQLEKNTDTNFWSVNHPDVLVLATLREVEGFYRNTEGYADFNTILSKKLRGIDVDLASISAADTMEMEG